MVFENLEILKKLSLKEREKYFGNSKELNPIQTLHRSNMMLNPLNLKHLNSLDNLEADAVTINLEDAIAPSRKKEALINTALALSNLKSRNSKIIIRVNPLRLGGKEEILFLLKFPFDAIRIPKVKDADEVKKALEILPEPKELHLSLETKEAFNKISSLKVDKRVTTLNLGILDLLADLNLPQSLLSLTNPTIEYILSKFLIDSKSVNFWPVSFMYQDYKNLEEFKKWVYKEKELGFNSKACMGPAQVEIVNEIFGITKEDLQRAKEIKEAFEEKSKEGIHGFMHPKYGFIDEPIYKDALNILNTNKIQTF
jgi:citrate lyase subunit beta/citryl-CoA lyase